MSRDDNKRRRYDESIMNNNQTEGSNIASWGKDRTRDTRDNRDSRDRDNRSYRDRDYREKDRDYRDRDRDRDRGRDYRDRERDRNNRDRGRDGGRVDGGGEGEKFWADPTDLSSFVLRGPNGKAVPLANGAGCSVVCNAAVESIRGSYMDQLRKQYNDMCTSRLHISPPKESFNRWLMERMLLGAVGGQEWLLPRRIDPIISPSMKRDLSENLPCAKFKHHRDNADIFSNIKDYAYSARNLAKGYDSSTKGEGEGPNEAQMTAAQQLKEIAEELIAWTKQEDKNIRALPEEMLLEKRKQTRTQCDPLVALLTVARVESICEEMVKSADEFVNRLADDVAKNTRAPKVSVRPHRSMGGILELILEESDEEPLLINQSHFQKLQLLFRLHCTRGEEDFPATVWCLLRRYKSFFGFARFEGFGLQAAIPPSAFKVLNEEFGVSFESFASPLNCYFSRFCSAFIDTDGPFGSCGSFYNLQAISGSFEANPPFTEELMEEMVNHLEELLAGSTQPLSFVIFIPEWLDPPMSALVRMRDTSKFTSAHFVVDEHDHKYVNGGQHNAAPHQRLFSAVHGTHVFFMQNDQGRAKWDPNIAGRIQKLAQAMKG